MRPTSETADVDVADSDAGFESMTVEVGQISGDGESSAHPLLPNGMDYDLRRR